MLIYIICFILEDSLPCLFKTFFFISPSKKPQAFVFLHNSCCCFLNNNQYECQVVFHCSSYLPNDFSVANKYMTNFQLLLTICILPLDR